MLGQLQQYKCAQKHKIVPKLVQHFAKYQANLKNIIKDFYIFAKVAKCRQICVTLGRSLSDRNRLFAKQSYGNCVASHLLLVHAWSSLVKGDIWPPWQAAAFSLM